MENVAVVISDAAKASLIQGIKDKMAQKAAAKLTAATQAKAKATATPKAAAKAQATATDDRFVPSRPATDIILVACNGTQQPFMLDGKLVWSAPFSVELKTKLAKGICTQPAYAKGGWFVSWSTNSRTEAAKVISRTQVWRMVDSVKWSNPVGSDTATCKRTDPAGVAAAAKWAEVVASLG